MAGMLPVPPRNLADAAYIGARSDRQLIAVVKDGSAASGLLRCHARFWRSAERPGNPGHGCLRADTRSGAGRSAGTGNAACRRRTGRPPANHSPAAFRLAGVRRSAGIAHHAGGTPAGCRLSDTAQPADSAPRGDHWRRHDLRAWGAPPAPFAGWFRERASDTLEITLPSRRFFAELYYDPFETSGDTKRFGYTFRAPYPIDQLDVEVQQPYTAGEFVVEPPAMAQESEGRDTTYHRFAYPRRLAWARNRFRRQLRQDGNTALRAEGRQPAGRGHRP